MGKGTKHKNDWRETILQTAIDARRLYIHSVKIMSNPKAFNPINDFNGATLKLIQETALTIYMDVWKANRINAVKHPEEAGRRLALQKDALERCAEFLALAELAKPQFHLPAAKFWNWMDMGFHLAIKIDAWQERFVKQLKEDIYDKHEAYAA